MADFISVLAAWEALTSLWPASPWSVLSEQSAVTVVGPGCAAEHAAGAVPLLCRTPVSRLQHVVPRPAHRQQQQLRVHPHLAKQTSAQPATPPAEQKGSSIRSVCSLTGLDESGSRHIHPSKPDHNCSWCCLWQVEPDTLAGRNRRQADMQIPLNA